MRSLAIATNIPATIMTMALATVPIVAGAIAVIIVDGGTITAAVARNIAIIDA